jgi:uncharacterized protein YdeI (YjbR/CyaY-like superfamily)
MSSFLYNILMEKKVKKIKSFTAKKRSQWRKWLEKYYDKEERVFLIRYKKHTGKPSFNQREAMDEAICFGWIDTTLKRIDDERYGVTFVKRNKKSRWSENTFKRARALIKDGLMTPAGLQVFKQGLKKPPHDFGIPKNPDPPQDLLDVLAKNKQAKENFEGFSPSYKKVYVRWILSAKRPETRMKRIKAVVQRAIEGNAKW